MIYYRQKVDIFDHVTEEDTMANIACRARRLAEAGGNKVRELPLHREGEEESVKCWKNFDLAQRLRVAMAPQIPERSPCVYLIQPEGVPGIFKIGVANCLPRRIKELQTSHYLELKVVLAIYTEDSPFIIERMMHKEFAKTNVRGEWFMMEEEDVARIQSNFSRQTIRYSDGYFFEGTEEI